MISEFVLTSVFNIVCGFFDLMPEITWDINSGTFSTFLDVVCAVGYFLPVDTVLSIVGLVIDFTFIRIGIRFITTIWDLLPIA